MLLALFKILEEYILSLKQKQFGSSNEKLSPTQAELFDEADGDAEKIEADNVASICTIEIPAHTRSIKRCVSIPADIPRIDIIHDLPDDQKICPHDGAALKRIGVDLYLKLTHYPPYLHRKLTHVNRLSCLFFERKI